MNEIKCLILAGGMGKRLWPVSRKKWPKYLMEFKGKSLLQQAYDRLNTSPENKYVVGAEEARFLVKKELSGPGYEFRGENIILEPLSRNTAPAIALGINSLDDEDIAVVLPADHIIEPVDEFNEVIRKAAFLAEKGFIVTAGIKPLYPATGYGYIKKGEKLFDGWEVEEFKEKPDREKAREYFNSGSYFWNAGIFVFKVSAMKKELAFYAGDIAGAFKDLKEDKSNLKEIYEKLPNVSIDYAVMEKTEKAAVVGFDGVWNDLGSWEAVKEVSAGEKENYSLSKAEFSSCENTFVSTEKGKFFAGAGLKDLIIVDTEDALLVIKKGEGQKVKGIVEKLKGREIVRRHAEDYRPWGRYRVLEEGKGYKIKLLFVSIGQRLSLQKHKYREEMWTVIEGKALITLGEKKKEFSPGESLSIPAGALHRVENISQGELKILELARGNKISEDDIIRVEDDYNRQ
ncbi:MAG: mannose-1-phosphate guanylyltransferase/mannose-6-phosphate isomerase [Elusimicrobiota bacterium]